MRSRTLDPVEVEVRSALAIRGVDFVEEEDPRAKNLDFYLPDYDLHIEVKQFHSDRSNEQLRRASNIILIQGMEAARTFTYLLNGDRPE